MNDDIDAASASTGNRLESEFPRRYLAGPVSLPDSKADEEERLERKLSKMGR